MFLQSEIIEERRLFTYEERSATLKRSSGVCACCGKKLTTKTMTMDHIIPISRGGTNEPDNLVALCPECNKEKGNLLYLPRAYYLAVKNNSELARMEKHVEKWFQTVKDQFDIERFPLIGPVTNMHLSPKVSVKKKKSVYIPSMILKWQIINPDYYAEIEAVTGINIREVRQMLPKINAFYEKDESEQIPTVALYSLRKKTSDKILAVVAVQLILQKNHMNIWLPWCELPMKYQGQILYNIVSLLIDSITRIAGYPLYTYAVTNTLDYHQAVSDFSKIAIQYPGMGVSYEYTAGKDKLLQGDFRELLLVYRCRDIAEEVREITPGLR